MISYGLANNGVRRGVHMQDCVKNKPLRDFANTMKSLASFAFKEQYYTDKALPCCFRIPFSFYDTFATP